MSGLRVFFVRGQFSVLPVSSGEKAGQVSTCPCLPRFACPWLLSFWASYHSLSTGELPLALTDALRLSPCVVYVGLPDVRAPGHTCLGSLPPDPTMLSHRLCSDCVGELGHLSMGELSLALAAVLRFPLLL